MIFRPTYVFNDITGITPKFLKRKHIKGIVLDVDNTLTKVVRYMDIYCDCDIHKDIDKYGEYFK